MINVMLCRCLHRLCRLLMYLGGETYICPAPIIITSLRGKVFGGSWLMIFRCSKSMFEFNFMKSLEVFSACFEIE